jgi:hypothetical protein
MLDTQPLETPCPRCRGRVVRYDYGAGCNGRPGGVDIICEGCGASFENEAELQPTQTESTTQ